MEGYLSVGQRCQACGQELFHHRADDGPAYLTVLIVGHVMAPLLLLCLYPLAARTFDNALFIWGWMFGALALPFAKSERRGRCVPMGK